MTRKSSPSIACLVLGIVAIGIEGLVISAVLSDLARDFGADAAQAAWAVAVYGLALAVTAPVVGLWGGRLPRKVVMGAGLATFVVAGLLCAVSWSFSMLVAARALCGAGAGAFLPSCYAYVGDSTPYEDRGRVMGRVMAGWSLALIAGVPLGSWIGELWGWRATFAGVGALGIVALLLVMRLPTAVPQVSVGQVQGSVRQDAMMVWRSNMPRFLLVNFLDMVSFYSVYTFLGVVVRERMGVGSAVFGTLVLCYGLGLLIGTMNARLLDRLGKELTATGTLALLVLVFAALPPATGSATLLATCMLAWGLLQGLTQTAVATLLTQAGGSSRSFATACMSCTTYLAVAAGAFGGGMLLDAHGFTALSWTGAGCVLTASLVLYRGRVRSRDLANTVSQQSNA